MEKKCKLPQTIAVHQICSIELLRRHFYHYLQLTHSSTTQFSIFSSDQKHWRRFARSFFPSNLGSNTAICLLMKSNNKNRNRSHWTEDIVAKYSRVSAIAQLCAEKTRKRLKRGFGTVVECRPTNLKFEGLNPIGCWAFFFILSSSQQRRVSLKEEHLQ